MDSVKVLGYDIFSGELNKVDFQNNKLLINTINPHSYCVAKNDPLFKKALLESDILLPDGVGIVMAARVLKGDEIAKIAGADIHRFLLVKLNESSGKVFYMGASQHTLDLIKNKVHKEFPNINFASYSPPYKSKFSEDDNSHIQKLISEHSPDVLFVGMTAPKQEKWVFENREKIDAKIIVSIGAVFDFYSGSVKRPSQFWINMGLEWLPRFLKEPKRLWKRNLISTPLFLAEIFKNKIFND